MFDFLANESRMDRARLVDIGGRTVEVVIRRSKQVRGHRITFRAGLPALLVVRPRATQRDIDDALAFHTTWLAEQLARAGEPCLGLDRLSLTQAQGRREAQGRMFLIAQSEAAALGVTFSRLTVRDQVSRWGSCSVRGWLSFNWRLVLAPHEVLDYVVVHEVCHLREHHHGEAFWDLVEERRPQYREAKEWLDANGWELLAYRPPHDAA